MKIALVTEDGTTISQHFGRAPYYMVISVKNGKIINREQRDKAGHQGHEGHQCHQEHGCHDGKEGSSDQKHGMDPASMDKHKVILAGISDCQVLIAGGMGWGAYESMQQNGIEAIITDLENIDEAVQTYLAGDLVSLTEKLH
ncbi:MAG: dinitrogenase iron-molybdenum cofactor biosynthesis protein [Dehalococcoidales bacterium]|nr:dinitrogenase iron-molybdenum cofactor biosynthesis protein [Dehalococcoidales bacterium]